MSTVSTQEFARIRETIDGIVHRAKNDGAYLQQLRDAPVETLQAAGLSDDVIGEFLHEEGGPSAEVMAYMDCVFTCLRTCGYSCWITI